MHPGRGERNCALAHAFAAALGRHRYAEAMPRSTPDAPEPAPAVASLRPVSALESVRARILVALRLGTLRPGDRIRSAHVVAAGLDASEITTRRALESLVANGTLVRRRGAGGGTFVADSPTIPADAAVEALFAAGSTARELVDSRVLMESALAGFAAQAADDAAIAGIRDAVARGEAAADWAEFHAADRAFHHAVAHASGVERLDTYFAALESLYAYFIPYPIEHLHASNDAHRRILEAIAAGDRALAADEARAHVAALYDEMFFAL